jgi:hypothetical protein
MKTKKGMINALSILIFAIGILLGTMLVVINTWGDLEAAMFDTSIRADGTIRSLNCPAMMTTSEIGTISASFTSTHVRPIERRIRIHISDGHLTLMREEKASLPLTPGKTEKLQWVVNPEDAAFDQIILVRVYMFPSAGLSSKAGSCGILVVDIPYFTGGQILTAAYIASFFSITMGIVLWRNNNKPLQIRKNSTLFELMIIAGSSVIGMIVSYLGWWMLGILSLALTLILLSTVSTRTKSNGNNTYL